MNAFPSLNDACLETCVSDVVLLNIEEHSKVPVGETVLLCSLENIDRRNAALHGEKLLFLINELLHLLKEVTLDLCEVKEFLDGSALAECLVHDELSFAAGLAQHGHELLERKVMEVLCESESVSADLKTADSLLKCFLICLTDAHYLADSTHLCAELVLNTLEFLKCPSCKLDNNVVAVRNVLVK